MDRKAAAPAAGGGNVCLIDADWIYQFGATSVLLASSPNSSRKYFTRHRPLWQRKRAGLGCVR